MSLALPSAPQHRKVTWPRRRHVRLNKMCASAFVTIKWHPDYKYDVLVCHTRRRAGSRCSSSRLMCVNGYSPLVSCFRGFVSLRELQFFFYHILSTVKRAWWFVCCTFASDSRFYLFVIIIWFFFSKTRIRTLLFFFVQEIFIIMELLMWVI